MHSSSGLTDVSTTEPVKQFSEKRHSLYKPEEAVQLLGPMSRWKERTDLTESSSDLCVCVPAAHTLLLIKY